MSDNRDPETVKVFGTRNEKSGECFSCQPKVATSKANGEVTFIQKTEAEPPVPTKK